MITIIGFIAISKWHRLIQKKKNELRWSHSVHDCVLEDFNGALQRA